MKVTVLGGGGFRVPMVYRALLGAGHLRLDEVALFHVDTARLDRIVICAIRVGRHPGPRR